MKSHMFQGRPLTLSLSPDGGEGTSGDGLKRRVEAPIPRIKCGDQRLVTSSPTSLLNK